MSILPFNLNTVQTGKAKKEKIEYIEPGAHECKVTGLTTVKETDKASTQEWKTKQIKDFLINAGVRDFSDDSNAMNDAVGKSLMVTFISDEYITVNRDTSEPVIKTSVKYRWSAKSGGKCTYNPGMNQTLSDADMAEFSNKHASWGKANAAIQEAATDEDMPF